MRAVDDAVGSAAGVSPRHTQNIDAVLDVSRYKIRVVIGAGGIQVTLPGAHGEAPGLLKILPGTPVAILPRRRPSRVAYRPGLARDARR